MKVNQQGKMKAWKEKIRKEARIEEKGEGSIMENREDSKEKKESRKTENVLKYYVFKKTF